MSSNRVKVGIVGLGRWAKVLTRAAKTSTALEKTYGVSVTVGHSARLMAGIRVMGKAIEAGELGRVGSWRRISPTSGRWS